MGRGIMGKGCLKGASVGRERDGVDEEVGGGGR